jgi:hypothetical protein
MAKGDKKQGEKSDAGDDREAPSSTWVCSACEQENEAVDGLCCACEEPRPDQAAEGESVPGMMPFLGCMDCMAFFVRDNGIDGKNGSQSKVQYICIHTAMIEGAH